MPAVRPATLAIPIADDSATVRALTRSLVAPVAGRIQECASGEAAVTSHTDLTSC